MPYVTSVERIAVARGIAGVLLMQLGRTCGSLPEEFEERVRELPFESLKELGQAVFDIRSLSDRQPWLDAREDSDESRLSFRGTPGLPFCGMLIRRSCKFSRTA
jgi:hypothetical protein